jgi:SH3-like domain-containing protein
LGAISRHFHALVGSPVKIVLNFGEDDLGMIRFALLFALALASGPAVANPAMTADVTTMRAAPSAHARVVQEIPARAQIDIGECGERWCAASWRDIDGFVRVDTVAPNDAPLGPPPPGPYAYGGPVVIAPVFGFGYYHRHW